MQTPKALLLTAVCATLATSATAADWLVISSGRDEVLMVDRASFKLRGDFAEASILRSFDKTVTLEDGTVPHRSQHIRLTVDCRNGTYGHAERVLLSEALGKGQVVNTEKPEKEDVRFAAPESYAGKMLLAMACGS